MTNNKSVGYKGQGPSNRINQCPDSSTGESSFPEKKMFAAQGNDYPIRSQYINCECVILTFLLLR